MFVPPTNKNLRESLVRLNLCTDRDFRRCRRLVRRLARGLPSFDFIWVDALVQLGVLTPFQANVLQNHRPESLCVGTSILLDRLGGGRHAETFLARTHGAADRIVLKRIQAPAEDLEAARGRLIEYLERVGDLDNDHIAAPHSILEHSGALITLSRHVDGLDCAQLLVRRGRFPVDVVVEIGRQLASGLAALEARGCLHGDIRLRNVRLSDSGLCVLVDAGVSWAVAPELIIRDDAPAESYDGIAPERIGTVAPATTATEAYAFGCLLWQLLAGRPPFPTGDPLGKLAAHQSRTVPDVRDYAPNTPAVLAEAIRALTRRDPRERPSGFAAVRARFGPSPKSGQKRLARFRRQFDTAAPRETTPLESERRFSRTTVALSLCLAAGLAFWLVDPSAARRVARLRNGVVSLLSKSRDGAFQTALPTDPQQRGTAGADVRPLPRPDAAGVIVLRGGSYAAASINAVGDLSIRGEGPAPSTIAVRDKPLQLTCRKLFLENVVVRREGTPPPPPSETKPSPTASGALLSVRSQDLLIERCAFADLAVPLVPSSPPAKRPAADPTGQSPAIAWTSAGSRDVQSGRLRVVTTVFSNTAAAVCAKTCPSRVEFENCLKMGGVLLDLRSWPTGRDLPFRARRVTLRQADALWAVQAPRTAIRSSQIRVDCHDCVFDLTGPRAALFAVCADSAPPRFENAVTLTGSDSVIGPDVPVLACWKPGADAAEPIEVTGSSFEGLAIGTFRFAGPPSLNPRDSSVDPASLQMPRRSDDPPGIVADMLPLPSNPVAHGPGAPGTVALQAQNDR